MNKIIASLGLLAAGFVLGGCVNVNADAGGLGDGGPRSAPPPDAASDPRSPQDLQRENSQMRTRLEELEKQNSAWDSTVQRQKKDIDDLKDQLSALKKDRDRAKKAAKG